MAEVPHLEQTFSGLVWVLFKQTVNLGASKDPDKISVDETVVEKLFKFFIL